MEYCVVEAKDGTISVATAFAGHQQGIIIAPSCVYLYVFFLYDIFLHVSLH